MPDYVTDTHALIWYLEDSPRLGTNASQIFTACLPRGTCSPPVEKKSKAIASVAEHAICLRHAARSLLQLIGFFQTKLVRYG